MSEDDHTCLAVSWPAFIATEAVSNAGEEYSDDAERNFWIAIRELTCGATYAVQECLHGFAWKDEVAR
ncbi:hypothetical protein [Ralstonia psammae]|uniref:hypothetical protein n=1 Tax=Ralstonia psammae TaxID=3058598 RepID=UPI00292CD043|nr:hypothetical protein [Ralstonia sp. LMG 19083]